LPDNRQARAARLNHLRPLIKPKRTEAPRKNPFQQQLADLRVEPLDLAGSADAIVSDLPENVADIPSIA